MASIKIKTKVDINTLSAISEYIKQENVSEAAIIEVRYFLVQILKKVYEKSCNIENDLPDIKSFSQVD